MDSRRIFTDEQEQILIQQYRSGISTNGLGIIYSINRATILSILIRNKIERRSNSASHRVYTLNEGVFDKINNEHSAYWLGFLFADGCVGKNRNQITVTLQKRDENHLRKLCEFFETNRPINIHRQIYNGKPHESSTFLIRSWRIANNLREMGITTNRKFSVSCFEKVPDKFKRHWIRGWFDGDGSVFTSSKGTLTLSFAGQKDLLLGVSAWMNKKSGSRIPNLQIRPPHIPQMKYGALGDTEKIYKLMYSNSSVMLDRKYNRFLDKFNPIV